MKKLFAKKAASVLVFLTMLTMLTSLLPVFAADSTAQIYLHCAAYYDSEGALVDAKFISGTLNDDEIEAFVKVYEPDGALKAKVFEWTEDLQPTENSGKEIDISDPYKSVVILHTNDMHGALAGSSSVIGSDSVAALKKLDDAVLADGGDAAQGVALASQSMGEDVITIMNAAGYDVMAVGNHEFDFGLEQLSKLRNMASFPMISANVYSDGSPLCKIDGKTNGENVIIDKNGVKVGFFALTTRNTATSTKPENLAGLEFRDEVETAKEQVSYLDAQGADVIIAITHMGVLKESLCSSEALANAMAGTELDAIIDGHSHTVINEDIGGITIAQTGTGGANVGRMEIDIDENNNVSINETMLSKEFFKNIEPDPDVASVIDSVSAELNETLMQEIGETEITLWGGGLKNFKDGASIAESRVGETNFGSIISDAMIFDAEDIIPDTYKNSSGEIDIPIVAIENGGGFRASVPNGKITRGSIINALPYANTVRIKEVTPAILYKALEGYIASVTAQDPETGFLTAEYSGSFPQIGGMRISYDPNKAAGEKLTNVSLIAENIDLDRNDSSTKIILASNDYVIEQGEFKDIPMIAEGSGLSEAVINYINHITNNGTEPLVMPTTTGRIMTDGAYKPKDYTAHINLKNADALNNGDTVQFYLDGKLYDKPGVLNNGVLDITVPDGAHSIKLRPDQAEVFVNNYSGNGVIDVYGNLNLGYPELEYQ